MKYNGIEYNKYFKDLTENVVSVLADGKFPTDDADRWDRYLADTCRGDRVLAVIEFPYIDIELEAYTGNGCEPWAATDDDNEVSLWYAVCIRGLCNGEDGWNTDDWAGKCEVDFSSDNWEELLVTEMCERLKAYAERLGYSFTEPNFDYV